MPFLAALGPVMGALGGGGGAVGLGANLLGGVLGGRAADDALGNAAQAAGFTGTNIGGDLGSVSVGEGGAINAQLTPQQQAIQSLLGGNVLSGLTGGQTAGIQNEIMGQFSGGQFTNLFQGLQGALSGDLSGAFGGQQQLLQGLLGQSQGGGAALQQALGGLGGNIGQAFGQGQGFLSGAQQGFQNAGNIQGLVDDRLAALRAQAAPQEDQQFNSLQNRLFSQGRLGGTGGSRDIEAFARGLGQADLSRQVEAQNLGMQQSQLLGNQASQQGQLGSQLFGQGFSGSNQLGALGGGLLGQQAGLGNQLFQSQLGQSDFGVNRAQQRMGNATNFLGLGQGLQDSALQRAMQGIGGLGSISSNLQGLINSSISASDARSAAGARQGDFLSQQQGSGGILSGLLGGLGGIF